MDKDFVPYEPSLALKEIGFDEPCFGLFSIIEHDDIKIGDFYFGPSYATKATEGKSILAPTYSQAFRWFREKHGVYTEIFVDDDKTFGFMITHFTSEGRVDSPVKYGHITYEEAESACLDKLIQIVTGTTKSSHTK